MKKIILSFSLILILVLINGSTFTVMEHEQGLRIQLGRVVGQPVQDAGLHFKLPFIQEVRRFDKRILQLDVEPSEVPTLDKKFIWVDTTARWKISNPLTFYKALRGIPNAEARMATIISGITKDTVSNYNLIEMVRNSNSILDDIQEAREEAKQKSITDATDTTMDELTVSVEPIQFGREKISELITQRSKEELKNFGIFLVDVQIRSIAYKEVVEQKVYKRMISERMKIATKIRSAGFGEKEKIYGKVELSLKKIESQAYKKSQEIRGQAEADAVRVYAEALNLDPEYYEFVRTLQMYENIFKTNSKLILSTDSHFLELLKKGFITSG